jgi:hypothetical protein
MLDAEDPEKLASWFNEAAFDLLAFISLSTLEAAHLFDRLIRAPPKKFQKKRLVPPADNESHKRT